MPGREAYRVVEHPTIEGGFVIQKPDGTYVLDPETNRPILWGGREVAEQQGLSRYRKSDYTSSHFPDVPNYVAHTRLNDRSDAQDRPGTFIEEIQSDRHQAGREKGYREPGDEFEKPFVVTTYDPETVGEIREISRHATHREADDAAMAYRQRTRDINVRVANEPAAKRVADAPFRKDWPVQMFKRVLRDAIANGKEWIGWTSGETQAERYDLSKQISEVHYSGTNLKAYDHDGNTVIEQTGVSREQLSDYIGKEAAIKLLEQPAQGTLRSLTGQDLKVGGEGMKGFYDKILPNEVGKYVKQWGGKVEQGELAEKRFTALSKGFHWVVWDEKNNRITSSFGSEELAQESADALNKTAPIPKIWKVEITPQMKETIPAKGQSLFGAVAPQQAEIHEKPVDDGTDVIAYPTAPQGVLTRKVASIQDFFGRVQQEGIYKTQGLFKAGWKFNSWIQQALQRKRQNFKAIQSEAAFLENEFKRVLKETYGKVGPDEATMKTMNLALGNIDNRLTQAQAVAAARIRNPRSRQQYIANAEMNNVFLYKQQQAAARNSLPAKIRDIIVRWNDKLIQMNDALLRDGDFSPDLKAAIQKNKGTYLHRSYQIFEDNSVQKQRIRDAEKNGDTRMLQIIAAAKAMIRQDVLRQKNN